MVRFIVAALTAAFPFPSRRPLPPKTIHRSLSA